jgi:5-methylcytosine-specific restriction endonuclease McrA
MTGPRNINVQIRELLSQGVRPVDIRKQFGCSLSTVTYHAKRMGRGIKVRPTYDWAAINAYHNQGHSISECVEKFGFSKGGWHKAKTRGDVIVRERPLMPLSILLTPGREKTSRGHVKARLLDAGLLEKKCALCGIIEWRGRPLAFNLDHVDGDKLNWALTNLRMVCPNCDSQQETFAGRNVGRLSKLEYKISIPMSFNGRKTDSESVN